ncbi:MAG: hypothetical protein KGI50_07075 [Patescibacteria group bacterium]|nr:hypothetical protein [Patescibacteria group bacterium]
MNFDKLGRKGISPIIATLLLILIAIAAGVVVYAYIIGFMGSTTSQINIPNTSDQVSIAAWSISTAAVQVFLQNIGKNNATLGNVYVYSSTGSLIETATPLTCTFSTNATSLKNCAVPAGFTAQITQTLATSLIKGQFYSIMVTTQNGQSISTTLERAS